MENLEKELLELYMPDIDWTRYEIEKIEKITDDKISPFTGRINFFITEKNIKPTGQEKEKLISKWFYDTKKIRDFQVRTKIATLHIKRRKWYNEDKNVTVSEDLKVNYEGIKSPEDLIFFFENCLKTEKLV